MSNRQGLYAVKKDGSVFPVEVSLSPFEDDLNHYVIASVRDVTEKDQIAINLRESEKKYMDLFMLNPYPMWIFDVDTLKFVTVNEAAINSYGYSREEFLSMTIEDIRPGEDVEPLKAALSSKTERYRNNGVWKHLKKDGSLIFAEVMSHAVPSGDGKNLRRIIAYDVTIRMKAEEALIDAKNKAEANDRLKTAFINNSKRKPKRI